ncbi:hypothetical protein Tco_1406199 [Tanacetum coccineum]
MVLTLAARRKQLLQLSRKRGSEERKFDPHVEEQFSGGRLYAAISSFPGQCGCADGTSKSNYVSSGELKSFPERVNDGQAPTMVATTYLRMAGRPPVLPSSTLFYSEMNLLYWHGPQPQLVVTKVKLIKEIMNNGAYPKLEHGRYGKKLLGDEVSSTEGLNRVKKSFLERFCSRLEASILTAFGILRFRGVFEERSNNDSEVAAMIVEGVQNSKRYRAIFKERFNDDSSVADMIVEGLKISLLENLVHKYLFV